MSLLAVATGVSLLFPTMSDTKKLVTCTLSDMHEKSCLPYTENLLTVTEEKQGKMISAYSNLEEMVKSYLKRSQKYATYTVKAGETLIGIAKKFGISATLLKSLNRITDAKKLREGQKLFLPISKEDMKVYETGLYRIKKGESLISIAKKFRLDSNLLAQYNGIKYSGDIVAGKVLKMPFKHIIEKNNKPMLPAGKNRYVGKFGSHRLRVTATAYTSHRSQTDNTPYLAAWNNRLRPGMKAIAVSRDLIYRYGLKNGTKVKISGLPGIYTVKDKMNKRFRKRIDIYMGNDLRRALRWGRRSVVISW